MADVSAADGIVFVTWCTTGEQRRQAGRLIESLRTFGGAFAACPVWLFDHAPDRVPDAVLALPGVTTRLLEIPPGLGSYILADKVCACAQAEALAGDAVDSLVWVNPECVFVQPPALLDLHGAADIALRPVHIRNVGAPAGEPLDDYWQAIYRSLDLAVTGEAVESFVDGQRIHPYFNTHVFAVNPALGLSRRWLDEFTRLVNDTRFQAGACADGLHRLFLHQAVFSALIVAAVPTERRRMLPPTYSYPYDLHERVPAARRARSLEELVCVAIEERSLDPATMHDITVDEPLRTWLTTHAW